MEDVGVGRKELTLLLKGNINGIVSDCFQQTSPGRKSPCSALLRQALVGSFVCSLLASYHTGGVDLSLLPLLSEKILWSLRRMSALLVPRGSLHS